MADKKKIAYVTGGMGGIGTSLCQRLHADGYTVIAGCGPSRRGRPSSTSRPYGSPFSWTDRPTLLP